MTFLRFLFEKNRRSRCRRQHYVNVDADVDIHVDIDVDDCPTVTHVKWILGRSETYGHSPKIPH